MKISKKSIESILAVAKIEDLFENKVKAGKDYIAPCPFCGKTGKRKGISISPEKNFAKCFSCGEGGNPVNYLINKKHITYPEALKELAALYNIEVDFEEEDQERQERLDYEKNKKSNAFDNLLKQVALVIIEKQSVSTSLIQREFSIGNNRAGRIIEQLEKCKIVGPFNGSVPRELLISDSKELDKIIKENSKKAASPSKTEKKRAKAQEKLRNRKDFVDIQLDESGLTFDDIRVTGRKSDDNRTEYQTNPFKKGTRDQYGKVIEGKGNDMLIYYYDLEGEPVRFKHPKKDQYLPLIRVRWQNPEAHKSKEGKPMKYQSPAGSGSHLYIPEVIRRKYKTRTPIDRLIIQEGEKKAEKACKHGLDSVGIMGIHNIAGKDARLPEELQIIIQECGVKEVFFLLDSDWQDIAGSVKTGSIVTTRPVTFFSAVRKYKEYMRTMYNVGSPVEIYFGHINHANQDTDKGIDDLLTNTLKGRENVLLDDFRFSINEKSGIGDYISLHKITTLSDQQIADFWHLNDHEKFYAQHKEILKPLKEFRFKKMRMRVSDDGKIELAQKINTDEKFWTSRVDKNGNDIYNFDYVNCFNFLRNRGFGRYELRSGEFEFVHIENKVVRRVDQYKIKDYITEFVETIKEKDVLNMLYRGGPQYLGQEKLSNLKYVAPKFDKATATCQSFYFKNSIWEVSADNIKQESHARMRAHIWGDRLLNFDAKVTEPLVNVEYNKEYDRFAIAPTETGAKCDFLQFLINTSNFVWRKMKKGEEITSEDEAEVSRHIVNKMTAIGYMLHDYKNDSELVAVVAMDGKLSEVGSSNGRSGKSLVGVAIEHMVPQVYIPAKDPKITEDRFIFAEVSERTKNVFIDDCRVSFDFEFLFPYITGKFKVNPKGGQPFTLDSQSSPKFYIPTNHTMMGEGGSFKDRQAFMVFSDFYNDNHKPTDDFGKNFWSDWDDEQWNLYYNLMATCVQLYLRSKKESWAGKNRGIVTPPLENVNLRKLRQQMGEDFIQWADEYFMPSGDNINKRLARKSIHDAFLDSVDVSVKKFYKATRFGKCIKAFCTYKGLHFNPSRENEEGISFPDFQREYPNTPFKGTEDKSGGVEYFTIANNAFSNTIDF